MQPGGRSKGKGEQGPKRERACDVVLIDSTCQDIWLEFLMGQQNKDSEAKKLYIQWQKLLPPNFVWVGSTDEWEKVLWIAEVSVILKCPHFLLGSTESMCDWGILAILNPSSCSLLLPGTLGTCAAHSAQPLQTADSYSGYPDTWVFKTTIFFKQFGKLHCHCKINPLLPSWEVPWWKLTWDP